MGFSFILLAGGNSNRFKSNIPKPYHQIAGKTLIDISINKIKKFNEIKEIILVYNKKHQELLKKIKLKSVKLIKGGETRNQSTYNALSYLKKKKSINKVLIHDTSRTNFSKKLIKKTIMSLGKNKVVIPI